MHWYYDHQGVADGPHDDAGMAAARKATRIHAQTLVWHRDLEAWQPAAVLSPLWWDHEVLAAPPPPAPTVPPESHRRPVPMAPSVPPKAEGVSLFRRLFGRGGRKT